MMKLYVVLCVFLCQILFGEDIIKFNEDIYKEVFTRFGNKAVQRVKFIEKEIEAVPGKTKFPYRRILLVNQAINKITYKKDIHHWGKPYNATFLEFVASGAGDSLDYAFAKYVALLSLGFDTSKFQFFQTSIKGKSNDRFDTVDYYVLGFYPKKGGDFVVMDCYKDKLEIAKGLKKNKYKAVELSKELRADMIKKMYCIVYSKDEAKHKDLIAQCKASH